MQSRTVPTPRDIAVAAPARQAPATPRPAPYDRHRWEEALVAAPLPHHAARLLGWGLAHLAGSAGYLPPGTARTERLAQANRLSSRQVRQSLSQLEAFGLIRRPDARTWEPKELARPVTLTVPVPGARTEPPQPGGADE